MMSILLQEHISLKILVLSPPPFFLLDFSKNWLEFTNSTFFSPLSLHLESVRWSSTSASVLKLFSLMLANKNLHPSKVWCFLRVPGWPSWLSTDFWFWFRSLAQSQEMRPDIGLPDQHKSVLEFSLTLPLPTPTHVVTLQNKIFF